jgi:hypothetical protein
VRHRLSVDERLLLRRERCRLVSASLAAVDDDASRRGDPRRTHDVAARAATEPTSANQKRHSSTRSNASR